MECRWRWRRRATKGGVHHHLHQHHQHPPPPLLFLWPLPTATPLHRRAERCGPPQWPSRPWRAAALQPIDATFPLSYPKWWADHCHPYAEQQWYPTTASLCLLPAAHHHPYGRWLCHLPQWQRVYLCHPHDEYALPSLSRARVPECGRRRRRPSDVLVVHPVGDEPLQTKTAPVWGG